MGYLQLSSGMPNFSKALISIWFRIPSEVFAILASRPYPISGDPSAVGDHMNGAYYNPPLYKIIPLLVLGSVETDRFGNPVQPSFIGIDCLFDGLNALACNLQTPVNGSVTSDVGSTGADRPGCFYIGGWTSGPGEPTNAYVAPDVWHHALISFDIGGGCSVDYTGDTAEHPAAMASSNTFTWALDDVSKVGPSMAPSGGVLAANGLSGAQIICNWMLENVSFQGNPSHDPPLAADTAGFGGGYIASAGRPIGIPASAAFVDSGYKIEMYRPQVWTGITSNAGDVDVRRLFIGVDHKPVARSLSESAFGPSLIIFKSTKDFKNGTNSGTLGNFTRNATINPFSPGP